MWQRRQLRETIISTGVVGAVIGALPALSLVASRSEYAHPAAQVRPLVLLAMDVGLVFLGSIAFCIVVFGLLPMALQYAFVWCVRRWTGHT
jgi:hypothetical protein